MTKEEAKKLFIAAAVCLAVAEGLSASIISNYFKEVYQVTSVQRGFLEIPRETPGILCVVVMSLLGSWGDLSLSLLAYGLAAVGLLVLGVFSPSYGMMMLFLFVFSLGQHMMMPLRDSISIRLSEEGKTGAVLGEVKGKMTLASMLTAAVVFIGFRSGFFWFSEGVLPSFCAAWVFVMAGWLLLYRLRKGCPELNAARRGKKEKKKLPLKREYAPYYAVTAAYGCQKRVRLVFAPWIIIELLAKGADTLALLGIVTHFAGSLFAPFVGRFLDKHGVKKALVLEGVCLMAIFGFLGIVAGGIASGRLGQTGLALGLVYLAYILGNLTDQFNMIHSYLMKKLSRDPEDVMENLSFGLSVDHIVAISVSGLFGLIWSQMGPEYVFYVGALSAVVQAGAAVWLRKRGVAHAD
jgi:hypothetical protein